MSARGLAHGRRRTYWQARVTAAQDHSGLSERALAVWKRQPDQRRSGSRHRHAVVAAMLELLDPLRG